MGTDTITHTLLGVDVPSGTCMATLVEPKQSTGFTRRGVLLVPPFGIEHAGSDRFLRMFADYAARRGHVVLTIEPVGTGDSTDLPDNVDLVTSYREAVRAGVYTLAALGTSVAVVSMRFGALPVAAVLTEREIRELVSATVLIEPVVRGRDYRRELLLLGASTMAGLPEGWAAPAGSILRPCDLCAIGSLDILELPVGAKQVLVVHGPLTPFPATTLSAWRAHASVETLVVPVSELVTQDPERGRVFPELIAGIADWFDRLPAPRPPAPPIGVELPTPFAISGPSWREVAVALPMADGEILHGIRTSPLQATRPGLILLPAGTNPRFGPARRHTVLARTLGANGVATLRMERRGAGVDGRTLDAYDPVHIADTRTIDAAAGAILGTPQTTIVAMRSGAWSEWLVTLGGLRATDVVLINEPIVGEDSWDLAADDTGKVFASPASVNWLSANLLARIRTSTRGDESSSPTRSSL